MIRFRKRWWVVIGVGGRLGVAPTRWRGRPSNAVYGPYATDLEADRRVALFYGAPLRPRLVSHEDIEKSPDDALADLE